MELYDLESDGFERRQSGRASRNCGQRLIRLRKCSPAICLVEALVIVLFVYLLLDRDPLTSNHHQSSKTASNGSSMRIFVIDDTQSLLLDLFEGCDQRAHDLGTSVQCSSSRAAQCGSVERIGPNSSGGQGPLPRASLVVTSKAGKRLERRSLVLGQVDCKLLSCKSKTHLRVSPAHPRQKIIGWGGALTDSSINNILSLTINGTLKLLDDYFGPDGLMFNMVRITIGGSDFSSRFYTNDDLEGSRRDSADLELKNFSLREEDILYKIPLLRLIQRDHSEATKRELKVFASMWSPPVWMKTNRHYNKGQLEGSIDDEPLVGGRVPVNERYYEALAELKVRFIKAYQKERVNVWGLTVMNEPQFAVQPFLDFNTMIFPGDDYANYLAKYLGPKIKNDAQLEHLKLMAHDDNRRYLRNYSWPILDQKRVRQFIDGVAVHGYADEAYGLMADTHDRYSHDDRDFFVLPTELCSGHLPFMAKALVGNWHRGVHYALDIIRSLQNAAAGWVDWNMALDLEGGPGWLGGRLDAPIIVDKTRDLYHKSPMFHAIGHFSRYIPPGAVRVHSELYNANYDHHFEVVSFLLPLKRDLVTVILNNNPYPIDLYLSVHDVNVDTTLYHVKVDADSISTLMYAYK